jgi:hypothetical protein
LFTVKKNVIKSGVILEKETLTPGVPKDTIEANGVDAVLNCQGEGAIKTRLPEDLKSPWSVSAIVILSSVAKPPGSPFPQVVLCGRSSPLLAGVTTTWVKAVVNVKRKRIITVTKFFILPSQN